MKTAKQCFALPNSKDNSRCIASCIAGIINAYTGSYIYPVPESLDEAMLRSGDPQKRTPQSIAAYFLADHGFKVIMNVPMPTSWYRIYKYGTRVMGEKIEAYLKTIFDIDAYSKALQLACHARITMRKDGYKNIKKIVTHYKNAFIMAGVNPYLLYDEKSTRKGGHYILVIGCDSDSVRISDPGLPYRKEMVVPLKNFNLAWKNNPHHAGELIISIPPHHPSG